MIKFVDYDKLSFIEFSELGLEAIIDGVHLIWLFSQHSKEHIDEFATILTRKP